MTGLSLLVVNYNSWNECAQALRSFRRNPPTAADGRPLSCEVIVVDNASPRRPPAALAKVEKEVEALGGELILHHENGGYSKGMNLAYGRARGDWILVSNPDVVFPPGCVDALLRHLEGDAEAACVVPKGYWDRDHMGRLPPNILPTMSDLLWSNLAEYSARARRRYTRRLLAMARRAWEAEVPIDLPMMSGCLFLMRRRDIEALGGLLDERYPLYYEDADLSVRIHRAGRTLVQVPEAGLVHLYNRSGQTDIPLIMERNAISKRLFYRKWYGLPGQWLLDGGRWLRSTRLGRRLAQRVPLGRFEDLGTHSGKPVLRLPRHCDRFLIQMSMDARFYLAGAVYGSGSEWAPSDEMFRNFGSTTYFYRAFDLGGDAPEELGRWRYTHVRSARTPVGAAPAGEG